MMGWNQFEIFYSDLFPLSPLLPSYHNAIDLADDIEWNLSKMDMANDFTQTYQFTDQSRLNLIYLKWTHV